MIKQRERKQKDGMSRAFAAHDGLADEVVHITSAGKPMNAA